MQILAQLNQALDQVIFENFQLKESLLIQPTRREFEGDYTLVLFGMVKNLKKSPQELGETIGQAIKTKLSWVESYNLVQGFLNIKLNNSVWVQYLSTYKTLTSKHKLESLNKKVMVEFSSPNTNKPLHLGHLRNNFLGNSISNILDAAGYEVSKTCLVNDRGIHICKSMIAYSRYGNGETPTSSGLKGDHLAGKYYVAFDKAYKMEISELMATGSTEDAAKKEAPIMKEAQELLIKWENGDAETVKLWAQLNSWVYEGFNETYKKIGVSFDKTYYESNTYLLGKDLIEDGLKRNVFFKKPDNSIWIDLSVEGLDEKLVLRGDGTSVYITQDLGTTDLKFEDFHSDKSIWVVGNEQDYHFKVLFEIMRKLGRSYADGCYHLSYGMVDLPSGKMKSREGTVVDADELISEMIATAAETTKERGKIDSFSAQEAQDLFEMLALGAIKYFLLKVEPKKRMLFNPEESIDFQGNTGPFIQYTHARIKSILRKAKAENIEGIYNENDIKLQKEEQELIFMIHEYNGIITKAAQDYSPAIVANYVFDLAKTFNVFYTQHSVMNEENTNQKLFRLSLIAEVAETIKAAMFLLGINVPERM